MRDIKSPKVLEKISYFDSQLHLPLFMLTLKLSSIYINPMKFSTPNLDDDSG